MYYNTFSFFYNIETNFPISCQYLAGRSNVACDKNKQKSAVVVFFWGGAISKELILARRLIGRFLVCNVSNSPRWLLVIALIVVGLSVCCFLTTSSVDTLKQTDMGKERHILVHKVASDAICIYGVCLEIILSHSFVFMLTHRGKR